MKKTLIALAVVTMASGTALASKGGKGVEGKRLETKEAREAIARQEARATQMYADATKIENESPKVYRWMNEKGLILPSGKVNAAKMTDALIKEVASMMENGSIPRSAVLQKTLESNAAVSIMRANLTNNKGLAIAFAESIMAKKDVSNENYDLANAIIKSTALTLATSRKINGELKDGLGAMLMKKGYSLEQIMNEFSGKDKIITMINNAFSTMRGATNLAAARLEGYRLVTTKAERDRMRECK